jgi:hypothetical protein
MPTILRSETRTISIAATPAAVVDVVREPTTLPTWAPDFARAIRPDGDRWLVDNGAAEVSVRFRVSADHGAVDLVTADDPRRGAFLRVLPNGDGSELLFTLFFPAGTPEPAVVAQMETVEGELATIRTLAEAVADES